MALDMIGVEWETKKTPNNIKDEQKARITAAFINLMIETEGIAYRRLRNHLVTAIEARGDFFQ